MPQGAMGSMCVCVCVEEEGELRGEARREGGDLTLSACCWRYVWSLAMFWGNLEMAWDQHPNKSHLKPLH